MSIQIEKGEIYSGQAIIKVVGVGGGGGNALNQMMHANIVDVEFITANTDEQELEKSLSKTKLQLGKNLTKGFGSHSDPDIGRQAAMDDQQLISKTIEGAHVVFIVAGMGGGTGTGAAPVVAQLAKDMGILTIAVVAKPFHFEGKRRIQVAEVGIGELARYADSVIILPNEKCLDAIDKGASLLDAFNKSNEMLTNAVKAIVGLITCPGLINVDLADVRVVMEGSGIAMTGSAVSRGADRAREATLSAISPQTLGEAIVSRASALLINITAGHDLTIGEFEEVGNVMRGLVSDKSKIMIGTVFDSEMIDEFRVTIIAAGVSSRTRPNEVQQPISKPVYMFVPDKWGSGEIADVLKHLSALYRSVGGDELIIRGIQHILPDSHMRILSERKKLIRKTG